MLVKFLSHGKGSARATGEQIEALLDKFEKTAWAWLEPDRYTWTAVLHHKRGGGVHAHILAAQCDLQTGRSLNIAPPGWQQTFAPLRDAFNHEHRWSRPDDPATHDGEVSDLFPPCFIAHQLWRYRPRAGLEVGRAGMAPDGVSHWSSSGGNLTPRPQIYDTHEHLSTMAEGHGQSGGEHYALTGVGQHALVHEVGLNEDGHRAVSGVIPRLPHRPIVDMLQGVPHSA